MKYMQKNGFFAFCVGLCGLLLGLTGCASVKNVMKKTSSAFSGVLKQSAPKNRRQNVKKRSGKKAQELAKIFPREIEAQYLARLDENRQVVPIIDSPNWDNSRYYAIRPEARKVRDPNFDSLAYAVDLDAGTVEILDVAYETEPFTGTVIVKHPNSEQQRLVAYVNRGIMVETGSLWDSNGTKQLRNVYDENGTLRESCNFDVNGTLSLCRIYDENGTQDEVRNYRENGALRLSSFYDENGSVKEDIAYYSRGIVSRRRTYKEDGSIDDTQFFDEKGKRDIRKEGSILVSDVRIKIVRLNLYPNPTQDNVPQIFDQRELDKEIPGDPSTFAFAFTGKVLEFYGAEYKIKKRQEEIKNGVHDGKSIWWHSNGKKRFEAEYVKGVPQGRTAWYREDGSMEYEGDWQDNKLVRATTWDASDQETGQVLDGTGELIYLHSNGGKRLKETYTDGDLTETEWWDEQGNQVESVDPARYIPLIPRIP